MTYKRPSPGWNKIFDGLLDFPNTGECDMGEWIDDDKLAWEVGKIEARPDTCPHCHGIPPHWVNSAKNIVAMDRDPAKREEARCLAVMLVRVMLANTPPSAQQKGD